MLSLLFCELYKYLNSWKFVIFYLLYSNMLLLSNAFLQQVVFIIHNIQLLLLYIHNVNLEKLFFSNMHLHHKMSCHTISKKYLSIWKVWCLYIVFNICCEN